MSHTLDLVLEVEGEPDAIFASKACETDAEVISHVDDFLGEFVKPDRGRQRIIISILSQ